MDKKFAKNEKNKMCSKLQKKLPELIFWFLTMSKNNWDEKMVVIKTQTGSKLKLANWGLQNVSKMKKSKFFQIGRNGETIG